MKILYTLLMSTAAAAVLAFGFAEPPFAGAQVLKTGRPAPRRRRLRFGRQPSIRDLKSNPSKSVPSAGRRREQGGEIPAQRTRI